MRANRFTSLILLATCTLRAGAAPAEPQTIVVFDGAEIGWDRDLVDGTVRDGLVLRDGGQTIETVVDLPPAPTNQRDAVRIVAQIEVAPMPVECDGRRRPADLWTRLGCISVVPSTRVALAAPRPPVAELTRFITSFGGCSSYTQDLTALAPLLSGRVTLRAYISTWTKSAWRISVKLTYSGEGVGYRRPVFALPVLFEPMVTSEHNRLTARIVVPPNLDRPRLRIITTGHATDGTGGDEFISRTHILRIDGRELARWRPWTEESGPLRQANPNSGRKTVDGRELWSTDFDRSGWLPGLVVEPLFIPLRELSASGEHRIELDIVDIRPETGEGSGRGRGYWRVSAILVADEHWPRDENAAAREKRGN